MEPEATASAGSEPDGQLMLDIEDVPDEVAEWTSARTIAWLAITAYAGEGCQLWRLHDGASRSGIQLYLALEAFGPMQTTDPRAALGMSPGSIYPALEELEDEGLVRRATDPLNPGGGSWVWLTDEQDPPDAVAAVMNDI